MTRSSSPTLLSGRGLLAAVLSLAVPLTAVAAPAAKHHHHHHHKKKTPAPAPAPTPADPAATPDAGSGSGSATSALMTPDDTLSGGGGSGSGSGSAAAPAPGAGSGSDATPPGDAPGKLPEKGRAPTEAEMAKNKNADVRPWATGVTQADQDAALQLFAQANGDLRDALFPKAADEYRQALTHWKHPAIYYNLALALVNLDQPVEMYDALTKAMAYGPAPLDEDKFERARGYKILVGKQLAHVELTCDTAGAEVFLDGKKLFTAPGQFTGLVRTGEHTVLAKGKGYAPTQLAQKLVSGDTMRLHLKLFTDAELTRYHRKMPPWVPYTVTGAGVLFAGIGGILHAQASTKFKDYDKAIAACAAMDPTGGCSTAPEYQSTKDAASSRQTLAFVGYGIGTAALAAGIILIVVNRPSEYRIDPLAEQRQSGVAITPVIGAHGGGVAATVHF